MKKLIYLTLVTICCACVMTACGSDDEPKTSPENSVPKISEFQAIVENKIWTPSSHEDITWITTDGQVLTANDMDAVSGSIYQQSYYFNNSEAVIFEFQLFGPSDTRAHKYNYTCDFDESKNVISFSTQENNAETFSIELESISADRMVIHDSQVRESEKGEVAYRRVVLVPVDKSEEQTWWDTYTL